MTQLTIGLTDNKDIKPWNDPIFAAKKLAEHSKDFSVKKKNRICGILEDIIVGVYQKDFFSVMPHIDEIIRNINAPELFTCNEYEIAAAGYSALEAVQSGFPKKVAALSLMNAWSQNEVFDEECHTDYRNEIIILEADLLRDSHFYTSHIRLFKSKSIYAYAADFFEMLLRANENKIENELRRRMPTIMKIKTRFTLDFLGEDKAIINAPAERQDPLRVTKTGRNDPCPCGSGKKYKKCCI